MNIIFDALLRLSASNITLATLVASILALLGLLYISPDLEATFARHGRSGREQLSDRLFRQLRQLRSADRSLKEQVQIGLFRDGLTESQVLMDSDLFQLLRVAIGIFAGLISILLTVLFGSPLLLSFTLLGLIGPNFFANFHNRNRTKQMTLELPVAVQRIATRIAAGAEIREAFSKVGARSRGPLFSELTWAARQMSIPGNEQYEIMRQLDLRNGMFFFARVADRVERASRTSQDDARQAFLEEIDRVLTEDEVRRQAKISGLPNRITLGMMPFLIAGLALAVAGPFIAGFINGGS